MTCAEPVRFFLPGPAYVAEEVRAALTRPVMAHRSPEFKRIYASLAERLPRIFRTRGEVFIASSSATLVMESAIVSTVRRDVLNLTCGAFSERWHTICGTLGKEADRVSVPWGQPMDPELVRQALRRKRYEAVTLVQNETSTGVLSPVAEIARVVREESDALLLVDAVSSLGGAAFETDDWHVDLVLVGVQKALALPPGLVLFSLSERAFERAAGVPHRGFYADVLRYRDQHRKGGTITTPVIPLVYALDLQADRILEEGMEARWQRHQELRRQTESWAEGSDFTYAAAAGARSPTVSCLRPPAGIAPSALLERLEDKGFTVASGYGSWKGETLRIGHMGEVASRDLEELFVAVDESVAQLRSAA